MLDQIFDIRYRILDVGYRIPGYLIPDLLLIIISN